MKKYNRDKRATYNAHARKINTHDTYDGRDTHDAYNHIHISIKYDGQRHTQYDKEIIKQTNMTYAKKQRQINVDIPNAINDIFPDINAPDNAHIYTGTAPYRQFIPQETYYTRPIDTENHVHTDTRRVKCIIYDKNDRIIHYGIFKRTRTVNYITHEAHITLHRADRSIEVRAYIPTTDTIYGVDIKEIKAHDVEFYHI